MINALTNRSLALAIHGGYLVRYSMISCTFLFGFDVVLGWSIIHLLGNWREKTTFDAGSLFLLDNGLAYL